MVETYVPKTSMDKFTENLKKKHDTKKVDEPVLKKETMEGILKGVLQVPEKLHMVSEPETTSQKMKKKGENPLHTGPGKQFEESTMDDDGRIRHGKR